MNLTQIRDAQLVTNEVSHVRTSPNERKTLRGSNMATIAAVMVANVLFLFGSNRADAIDQHSIHFRHLDDLAMSVFIEARELRWELHDNFTASPDYNQLMNDADDILKAVQRMQLAVLAEKSENTLSNEANRIQTRIDRLKHRLGVTDFATIRPAQNRPTFLGNGYRFTPETRHAGAPFVKVAMERIVRLEGAVGHFQSDIVRAPHPPGMGSPGMMPPGRVSPGMLNPTPGAPPALFVPGQVNGASPTHSRNLSETLSKWTAQFGF